MFLFFHELFHLTTSLSVGYLVWRYGGKRSGVFLAALLGGFFIDADHLFDYFIAYGIKFNLRYFLNGNYFLLNDKIILPLHSWELAIIILLFLIVLRFINFRNFITLRTYLFAFTLALLCHLLIDTIQNNMKFSSYSIIRRVQVDFKLGKLIKSSPTLRFR